MSPISANEYTESGKPWCNYSDDDNISIEGVEVLVGIKSIKDVYKQKIKGLFTGNSSNKSQKVRDVSPKKKNNISNGFW